MLLIREAWSRPWLLTLVALALLSTAAVATGQGHVVVANRASGNISVIDVATDTAVAVQLPGAAVREPM